MRTLTRRVGLGLGSRGDIDDVIEWARRARDAGLDSVWMHDTPYERDGVTYSTAIATSLAQDPDSSFRVAIGALNPFTRHTLVLAMTGSGLDEILPKRIVMGIGTGMPLRLKQMGIPYSPEEAVARVEKTFGELRTLWAGERLPSATPGLPTIQPMFPPVNRIPLYVAAYRKEFVELAGRIADGYLGRPAESIPSLNSILCRLDAAAVAAGRDPRDIDSASYLLSLVDKSRREALNRAKREPFVIYMMSILGEVSLKRAGFDPELRDRISAAWKAEDYHEAGKQIPDDLLDAFMLCGTREDIAGQAMRFHAEAGLKMPLLQPIVQEDAQVRELIESAKLYADLPVPSSAQAPEAVPEVRPGAPVPALAAAALGGGSAATAALAEDAPAMVHAGLSTERGLNVFERAWRLGAATWEIVRPNSTTGTFIPVLASGALAVDNGLFAWIPFVAALVASVLLQTGANAVNEGYDVRQGIDTIRSPRMSHAVLKGRFSERAALGLAFLMFGLSAAIGLYLIWLRGPVLAGLGALGMVAAWAYTAPPLQLKYHALGIPMVFTLFGPLMSIGAYFAITGQFDPRTLVLAVPPGLLITAVVHGNDWRDISDDSRAGIGTFSSRFGRDAAHWAYLVFVLSAYVFLALAVALTWLPATAAIAVLSVPLLAWVLHSAELGATGQMRAIAKLDLETAWLHLVFGLLLVAGLLLAQAIH
jgi:1,4-dihydroxy-2-naphthoate polyprenyltransferase